MNKLVNLREVAEIVVSNVDKKYNSDEKEITLCNYTDVYKNWAITLENSKSFMLATAKEKEIEKFILKKGQVAITKDSEKKDDIGISAYISKNFNDTLLGYHCALITPNAEYLNGKFLNVFLHSKLAKKYFENQASGSGQRYSLSLESLNSLKIPLFNIGIQKKIGELYSNIDKKIELNKKINSELETMAKTIYDYWFLQVEFPNEEGKPYKSSGGKMVWNEELKREIPEGWEVRKLEDYCNIFTGRKDVNQALEKGKYKFYSCSPNYKFSNDKLYEGKAILIAGNGSYTGRTIFVNEAIDLYQRTYACVSKNTLEYMEYLYYTLLKFFVPIVSGGTHGSAIPYIVLNDIAKQKILINKSIVEKFQDILVPIQNKIFKLKLENEELTSLRDFLLPLLMNGQVGFKE